MFILDSLFGTVAKLEGSVALALSRWCCVTGWSPGLDGETWAEFKTSHLLTMRVGQVTSLPWCQPGLCHQREAETSDLIRTFLAS